MPSVAARKKSPANSQSSPLSERISALAKKLHPELVKVRRHLHQNPELSNEEFKTTEFLRDRLKKLPVTFFPLDLPTGLVVDLKGADSGETVVVRTDIDALPILEKNDIPFKSRVNGKMHACGHDVHMATVLGTVMALSELRDEIKGTVRFLFQPAEELPPGGARPIIAAGALSKPKVKAVMGLHVDPRVPVGKIGLRDGVTMASVTDVDIHVYGKSGHAARPHDAIDSIATAGEIIDSIQKLVSRETDPLHPVVVTVGTIQGGTARNVIADHTILQTTIRTLSIEDSKRMQKSLKRCVEGVCKARGARAEVQIIASYPPLINTPAVNRIFESSYTELYGPGRTVETEQVLGGEDFACYLEHAPGAMFRLGIRNPKIGATENWHSDHFMVDEAAISHGVALLTHAAITALRASLK